MEVLADLPRPGHYLLRNPLTRPVGIFSDTCWRTCQLSTLILTTVELMSPVIRTWRPPSGHIHHAQTRATYHPNCLRTYLHTLLPAPLPCPTELVPSSEAPSGPQRLLATYLCTNSSRSAFNVRGEPFGSPLKTRRIFRRFPIKSSCTGGRPWGQQLSCSRHLAEVPDTYLRTYPFLYLL